MSTYFTIQLIFATIHSSIALFGTIHRSHYIISANFYLYLQYFSQKNFTLLLSKIPCRGQHVMPNSAILINNFIFNFFLIFNLLIFAYEIFSFYLFIFIFCVYFFVISLPFTSSNITFCFYPIHLHIPPTPRRYLSKSQFCLCLKSYFASRFSQINLFGSAESNT